MGDLHTDPLLYEGGNEQMPFLVVEGLARHLKNSNNVEKDYPLTYQKMLFIRHIIINSNYLLVA
jgi:hypothetical protein